jgi:hypothetical protein
VFQQYFVVGFGREEDDQDEQDARPDQERVESPSPREKGKIVSAMNLCMEPTGLENFKGLSFFEWSQHTSS